ncbi:hypothetical protein VDG05_02380 [Xanthomonas campestris pv. raphani]|uniref:hypothetical protein n=1 Tax=Xanthomonas campestris TaxID=339 RepID=UPI002B23ACF9|nr:hypothetical protein [Xanthomonas campestris]MEA9883222.1 hypothetical protein [Xanthomonas campestris pv. raphani]MEB2181923.1 hypothetical protein [Xanthomonas campestris pv. campestris]
MQHRHRHRVRWGAPLLVLTLLSACRLPLPGESDQAVVPMDADRVLIGRVQGVGASSPLLGQEVRIEGIVTRSLAGDEDDLAQEVIETVGEGTRSRPIGWFVQDEGDGLDATSDALFVLDQGYETARRGRVHPALGHPCAQRRPRAGLGCGSRGCAGHCCRPAPQQWPTGGPWRCGRQHHHAQGGIDHIAVAARAPPTDRAEADAPGARRR